MVHDLLDRADGHGAEGSQRSAGNAVHADVLAAEFHREVARVVLECGFGNAHDVVAGDDLFCAVVAQRDDAAAVGHDFHGVTAHRDQRIRADFHRLGPDLPWCGGELADLEVVLVAVGDRVDDKVNRAEFLFHCVEEVIKILVVGGVEFKQPGVFNPQRREGTGDAFFVLFTGQVGEQAFRASVFEGLGNVPGVTAFIGDAKNNTSFAGHVERVESGVVCGHHDLLEGLCGWGHPSPQYCSPQGSCRRDCLQERGIIQRSNFFARGKRGFSSKRT